jgi:hypothetical protein
MARVYLDLKPSGPSPKSQVSDAICADEMVPKVSAAAVLAASDVRIETFQVSGTGVNDNVDRRLLEIARAIGRSLARENLTQSDTVEQAQNHLEAANDAGSPVDLVPDLTDHVP